MTFATMKPRGTPQERMDAAFDNYFALSDVLRDDLLALRRIESEEQHWRRNFIRAGAALFEGYAHCLREMCAVSFECKAPELTDKEEAALRSEGNFASNDRIRLTLRAAYKLFKLAPPPNFGCEQWSRAQRFFRKRDSLMHAKTSSDLSMADEEWADIREGVAWVLKQFIDFFALLQEKYAVDES
jgi:hypothetical protein